MININSGNGLVANMLQAIAWTNADQGFSWGMLLKSHNELKVIHGWLQHHIDDFSSAEHLRH